MANRVGVSYAFHMNPSDVVVLQGGFATLNPTSAFLKKKGIPNEIFCPPGKDPGG
ncbi:MAG: hypothetical protein ACI9X4_002741 [Glaciecola sp.]